jgi:glycosyltransferase 2 family protein
MCTLALVRQHSKDCESSAAPYNAHSMLARIRPWWPYLKAVLALAILVGIGRQFAQALRVSERGLWGSLRDLGERLHHPGWIVLSGVFYAAGLGFSAAYWCLLLRALGYRASIPRLVRGYYIGQLGKYLPGKAWALVMRAGAAAGPDLPLSVGILTSFYEVLTTMAGGALTAAIILWFLAPAKTAGFEWQSVWNIFLLQAGEEVAHDRNILVAVALIFFTPLVLLITPVLFNRIIRRINRFAPFAADAPHLRPIHLFMGLVVTSGTWLTFGLSGWSMLCGLMLEPPPFELEPACRIAAYIALAYVAGFFILVVPSGLGVREYFLLLCLAPELTRFLPVGEAAAVAAVLVLMLRLVWTIADLVMAALVYWLPVESVAA